METRRSRKRLALAALVLTACGESGNVSPVAEADGETKKSALNSSSSFTLFESGHVRPLATSPNGKLLFATNTPDNRLEVFRINHDGGLSHRASIPVGLEPVAVAARSN